MVNNYICPPYNTSGMLRQDYNPLVVVSFAVARPSEAVKKSNWPFVAAVYDRRSC